jgi:hypothetical protein
MAVQCQNHWFWIDKRLFDYIDKKSQPATYRCMLTGPFEITGGGVDGGFTPL